MFPNFKPIREMKNMPKNKTNKQKKLLDKRNRNTNVKTLKVSDGHIKERERLEGPPQNGGYLVCALDKMSQGSSGWFC